MFWTSHNDIEKTREWIAFELGQIEKQDWYRFAIVLKDTNTLIGTALSRFEKKGIEIPEKEYLYSILLANPDNAYTIMNEGYCGDGGIPGYIMAWLVPGEETIRRLPAALVHETNHNVRYQFIKWTNDITLGEMLVSEGLAENYATTVFGEEFLGPWVTKTDNELFQLIFRELEFPLKDIRRIIESPDFDREKDLEQQIHILELKKEHIENLIDLARGVKKSGVKDMTNFTAFDTAKIDDYIAKARDYWGDTAAFKEFEGKNADRTSKPDFKIE